MIVLKILLWIFLVILGLIVLVCAVPADVDFSYIDGKMKYKIKLWFFDLMDSSKEGFLDKRKRKKKLKAQKKKEQETAPADSVEEYSPPEDIGSAEDFDNIEVPEDVQENESPAAETVDEPIDDEPVRDKKKKKEKKNKKKDKTAEDELPDDWDDGEDDDGEEKKSIGQKLEKLGNIWLAAKNPANMIFKGFKFRNFYIDFIIANEDAYKCALSYGRYSTLIYCGLAQFSRLFTIRFKTVDIQPGFGLDKGRWDTSFSVRFRLGTAVIAGIWFIAVYLFRVMIPGKLKKRREKRTAAVQK